MNIESLREYCMAKKGAEETLPFGPDTLVFKVGGKMFLIAGLEYSPMQFNVKCEPEKAIALREQYTCIIPGFHMSKSHWNTVIADGTLTTKQLHDMIDDSYQLIISGLSKKLQQELLG
jgi:predicted DNA-binding protein (MmcQ/YjbR family)